MKEKERDWRPQQNRLKGRPTLAAWLLDVECMGNINRMWGETPFQWSMGRNGGGRETIFIYFKSLQWPLIHQKEVRSHYQNGNILPRDSCNQHLTARFVHTQVKHHNLSWNFGGRMSGSSQGSSHELHSSPLVYIQLRWDVQPLLLANTTLGWVLSWRALTRFQVVEYHSWSSIDVKTPTMLR